MRLNKATFRSAMIIMFVAKLRFFIARNYQDRVATAVSLRAVANCIYWTYL